MLTLELSDLSALGADLALLGFSEQELSAALTPADSGGLTDENEVPALAETPVSCTGDIWCLGPHRLACGDSTDGNAVKALLGSLTPQLMVTDPPYGVSYDPTWRHRLGVNQSARVGKVRNDERADWEAAWALFPGHIAYVWHGALHATTVADSLVRQGFAIRSQIIWAKERLVIGRGDYHWQHEPCWYAVRTKGHWTGDRKQTTLWTIPSGGQDAETAHGTQKPVECMRRPLLNNSSRGQAVYDPFLGSGTTLIAAQTAGRVCLGLEIDPLYVDVAVRRWQAFTGDKASLLADGRTFDTTATERVSGKAPAQQPTPTHDDGGTTPVGPGG
jgi:DNA modification methylase